MRAAMVSSQLRTNAVNDPAIIAAMETVSREHYVPADRVALAYIDVPVPLGNGRFLNAPLVTGRLLSELAVAAGENILLIGAATGYAAALLDRLGAHIVAVEVDPALCAVARSNLSTAKAVTLVEGPLEAGSPNHAPFDAIIVDGAIDHVPQALWDQLKEGGRIATGLVDHNVTRLANGRRVGEAGSTHSYLDVEAAQLPGFDVPAGFSF